MLQKEVKKWDTEKLILGLCARYDDERISARKEEEIIIDELSNRKVIKGTYMKRLLGII